MAKRVKSDDDKEGRGSRGEGSVFQRTDGRWVASIPLGDGKKKTEYYDDKRSAERARRRMLHELETGRLVTGKGPLLGEYLDYWLGIQRETLKASTYSMYYRFLMKRVTPALGQMKLQNLTGDMFQSLYVTWRKEEMAATTIRMIHTILKRAFDDAVRWKKISFNPVRDADPPRVPRRDMQVLDISQSQKLLEFAKGTKFDCLLHIALLGLRKGEILGLRWQDIDFERKELRISRALSYIHNPDTGHYGFVIDEPKTASSRRTLSLPKFIINSLHEHRMSQQEKQSRSPEWSDLNLVFCTGTGSYLNPQNIADDFDRLLSKAGLPDIRFHDLRHSAATIWIALGVNPKVIQELLGHSDISTTLRIYSHVLPPMQQQVVDQLDALFGEQQNEDKEI